MEINVNGKVFPVNIVNEEIYLDDIKQDVDIKMVNDQTISLIHNGKQTTATIESVDKENKKVRLNVAQHSYEVAVKDKLDLLLSKLGMADLLTKKMADLKSPMPGLVLQVLVSPGQEVAEGDVLIVLEAMKMENSLKATADGVVASVNVSEGESVEKGYTLISFQ